MREKASSDGGLLHLWLRIAPNPFIGTNPPRRGSATIEQQPARRRRTQALPIPASLKRYN